MKCEEIEAVLKEIHCKGFVFVLEPLMVDIKSVAMNCINNLPLETRESIYEILTADKCYFKLEVIALGYDAGIDRSDIKFNKYWLVTPDMNGDAIVKMAFEAVLSASQMLIKEEFTYCGQQIYSNKINVEALAFTSELIKPVIDIHKDFTWSPISPNDWIKRNRPGFDVTLFDLAKIKENSEENFPDLVVEEGILVQKKEAVNV